MTQLGKFQDAFAIVKVATYQPVIVKWFSVLGLTMYYQVLARRFPPPASKETISLFGGPKATSTALRFSWRRPADLVSPPVSPAQPAPQGKTTKPPQGQVPHQLLVQGPANSVGRLGLAFGLPNTIQAKPVELTVSPNLLPAANEGDYGAHLENVNNVFKVLAVNPKTFVPSLKNANIPTFLPDDPQEALSPIAIMHLYRQLYFDVESGVGPIIQMFSIAPKEAVEVTQETTRRQSFEQTQEFGSETTQESEQQSRNLDEISDQVDSTIKQDASVAISADASGNIGVYQVGVQASTDLGMSSQESEQHVKKTTLEVTKRSAQVIRKSYKLTVKSTSEVTEYSSVKRTITNDGDEPVNYALRQVLRKVRVKVQDLGPRLCWQIYISKPGEGLARSKFVVYQESQPIAQTGLPPGAPQKPQGGQDTHTETIMWKPWHNPADGFDYAVIDIPVAADTTKDIRTITIDNIQDANPGGKNKTPPSLYPAILMKNPPDNTPTDGSWIFRVSIAPGDASSVTINFTAYYDPSQSALTDWQSQIDALKQKADEDARKAQFDNYKKMIVAKSKIQSRPATDLRKEERYEIMNRLISDLFASNPTSGVPSPLEIEYFHRFFEEPSIFYFVHPSWWRPRYNTLGRPDYEVTEDSEPETLGKSLGWLIQMDGDRRRNEFLNSPWVRVCIPIRPGLESKAVDWLAEHFEGQIGFDTSPKQLLGQLLADIKAERDLEGLAKVGPDYVTLDGEVAPDQQDDAKAFPIISEFDIILPTEGFAYDKVTIAA